MLYLGQPVPCIRTDPVPLRQRLENKPGEEPGSPVGDTDFRGRQRAHEGLFFIAYGLTANLAVEFEVAGISATLDKASTDASALAPRTQESGLGDIETQVRWRWSRETNQRPELFGIQKSSFRTTPISR